MQSGGGEPHLILHFAFLARVNQGVRRRIFSGSLGSQKIALEVSAMRSQFARRLTFALAVVLAVGLCFDEAGAQRRRTRRSRRVTRPVVVNTQPIVTPTPSTADPQIISTAEQQAVEEEAGVAPTTPARRSTRRRAAAPAEEDEDTVRRTVNNLSTQVTKLSEKLSQMEQQQR